MRKLALVVPALASVPLAIWACGGDDNAAPNGPPDAAPDVTIDVPVDNYSAPLDGTVVRCKLDNGTDPVNLCLQKRMIESEHASALVPNVGVASSWNYATFAPDTADGGAQPAHDFHDDIGYGSELADYLYASQAYGDNEIAPLVSADIETIAHLLEGEVGTPPAEYRGDTYLKLEKLAQALRTLDDVPEGDKIDGYADAYARGIYTGFAQTVSGTDVVLGLPAGGGGIAYSTADVATGAVALLALASTHANLDDGGAVAVDAAADEAAEVEWVAAAVASFDHLYLHARDPGTGLYYRALVASASSADGGAADAGSGDAGVEDGGAEGGASEAGADSGVALSPDELDPSAPAPIDGLLTDVQGEVMLALMRANDIVQSNPAAFSSTAAATYPFVAHAEELFLATYNSGLWDPAASSNAGDGGAGFMEAIVASSGQLFTNKTTRANARLFAALHRDDFDDPPGPASPLVEVLPNTLNAERLLLTDPGQSLGSSFLSVVAAQQGYFRASSRAFGFAVLDVSGDAGSDAGLEPLAQSYHAASIHDALESMTEQNLGPAP
jgi:hypothetical protein